MLFTRFENVPCPPEIRGNVGECTGNVSETLLSLSNARCSKTGNRSILKEDGSGESKRKDGGGGEG